MYLERAVELLEHFVVVEIFFVNSVLFDRLNSNEMLFQ